MKNIRRYPVFKFIFNTTAAVVGGVVAGIFWLLLVVVGIYIFIKFGTTIKILVGLPLTLIAFGALLNAIQDVVRHLIH